MLPPTLLLFFFFFLSSWLTGVELLGKETQIITCLRIILIIQFWKKSDFGDLFIYFIYTYKGFLRTSSSKVLTVTFATSAFWGKKLQTRWSTYNKKQGDVVVYKIKLP